MAGLPRSGIEIAAIGGVARQALAATEGTAQLDAALSGSWYLVAGEEIICALARGVLPHARAMLLREPLPQGWRAGVFAWAGAAPWMPALPQRVAGGASALASRARALAAAVVAARAPAGMASLLSGRPPSFPLAAAATPVLALAAALECPPADAAAIARELVGLGPGLTPSGDDYLAGLALASFLRTAAEPALGPRAAALRAGIAGAVPGRTNRISEAFLRDAVAGLGFAALHALGAALAAADVELLDPALAVAAIGHTSGWDMLTGFLAGLGGLPRS